MLNKAADLHSILSVDPKDLTMSKTPARRRSSSSLSDTQTTDDESVSSGSSVGTDKSFEVSSDSSFDYFTTPEKATFIVPFIKTGYRKQMSFYRTARTLFVAHNEAGNVWSQVFSSFVIAAEIAWVTSESYLDHLKQLDGGLTAASGVLSAMLTYIIPCLVCAIWSGIAHQFCSMSMRVEHYVFSVDYIFAHVHVLGMYISMALVALPSFPIAGGFVLSVLATIYSLRVYSTTRAKAYKIRKEVDSTFDDVDGPAQRTNSSAIHFLVVHLPLYHRLLVSGTEGFTDAAKEYLLYYHVLYVLGATCYGHHVPQRFFQDGGIFNVITGHTLMHVFCVVGQVCYVLYLNEFVTNPDVDRLDVWVRLQSMYQFSGAWVCFTTLWAWLPSLLIFAICFLFSFAGYNVVRFPFISKGWESQQVFQRSQSPRGSHVHVYHPKWIPKEKRPFGVFSWCNTQYSFSDALWVFWNVSLNFQFNNIFRIFDVVADPPKPESASPSTLYFVSMNTALYQWMDPLDFNLHFHNVILPTGRNGWMGGTKGRTFHELTFVLDHDKQQMLRLEEDGKFLTDDPFEMVAFVFAIGSVYAHAAVHLITANALNNTKWPSMSRKISLAISCLNYALAHDPFSHYCSIGPNVDDVIETVIRSGVPHFSYSKFPAAQELLMKRSLLHRCAIRAHRDPVVKAHANNMMDVASIVNGVLIHSADHYLMVVLLPRYLDSKILDTNLTSLRCFGGDYNDDVVTPAGEPMEAVTKRIFEIVEEEFPLLLPGMKSFPNN